MQPTLVSLEVTQNKQTKLCLFPSLKAFHVPEHYIPGHAKQESATASFDSISCILLLALKKIPGHQMEGGDKSNSSCKGTM